VFEKSRQATPVGIGSMPLLSASVVSLYWMQAKAIWLPACDQRAAIGTRAIVAMPKITRWNDAWAALSPLSSDTALSSKQSPAFANRASYRRCRRLVICALSGLAKFRTPHDADRIQAAGCRSIAAGLTPSVPLMSFQIVGSRRCSLSDRIVMRPSNLTAAYGQKHTDGHENETDRSL